MVGRAGVSSRVSVIIPTKNRLPLLREALGSLQNQRHSEWEALIVDDGSEDGTPEEVTRWSKQDGRVRLVVRNGSPPGANHCRNLGIGASSGEYLVFLDSDDALSPRCLSERVRVMGEHAELDFAVFPHQHFRTRPGDMERVYEAQPGRDDIERYLRVDVPWQTGGPIWRRRAVERLGPWDERLPCWQDWDFSMRALARGARYRCVPDGSRFFHRVQGTDRPSISGTTRGPPHLRGMELAVRSACQELASTGRLTPGRRALLARLHLSLAEQWCAHGHAEEARAVWRRCRVLGLIEPAAFVEGLAFLSLWRARPVRGLLRRLMRLRWLP